MKMKNTYTNPMIDIKRFNGEDIVTSSAITELKPIKVVGGEEATSYGWTEAKSLFN